MSLARSTLVVGLATAVSRLLGFARDILIAGTLGAGPVADAFLVAFRLPNLFRRILGEGGLNAGFVPLYARLRAERGDAEAREFAGEALAWLAMALVALLAAVELGAGLVVLGLAAGYAEEDATFRLATLYTRVAFPFVAGVTLASLLAALLNAERRFAAASLAPVAVNAVLIAALLLLQTRPDLPPSRSAFWLAAAVAISGVVHLAIVAVAARGFLATIRFRRLRLSADLRRLFALGASGLAASGAAQFIVVAGTQVASFTPSAVSWLYYADRVFQLPLGFVGSALGIVLLSDMAARHAQGDWDGFAASQNRALEWRFSWRFRPPWPFSSWPIRSRLRCSSTGLSPPSTRPEPPPL
jgi:putative peptidoglycan lipid II flippase